MNKSPGVSETDTKTDCACNSLPTAWRPELRGPGQGSRPEAQHRLDWALQKTGSARGARGKGTLPPGSSANRARGWGGEEGVSPRLKLRGPAELRRRDEKDRQTDRQTDKKVYI